MSLAMAALAAKSAVTLAGGGGGGCGAALTSNPGIGPVAALLADELIEWSLFICEVVPRPNAGPLIVQARMF